MSGILSSMLMNIGGDGTYFINTIGYTVTTSSYYAYGPTFDSSGNVYATILDNSDQNGIVVKYSSSGALSWQRAITFSSGYANYISAVDDGSGGLILGGTAVNTGSSIWYNGLAKLSQSAGTTTFQRTISTTGGNSSYYSVSIDTSGNIYGIGRRNASSLNPRIFLAKYNSSGTIVSQQNLSSSNSTGYQVVLDSSNLPYICGEETNGVFAKLTSSFTTTWGYKLTKSGSTVYCRSIDVDSSGNVYVSGYYTLSPYGECYVQKYNSSGTLQWGASVKSASASMTQGKMALDSNGNVYLGCYVGGSVAVFKYNSSGTLQWQRSITNWSDLLGLSVTPSGSVILSGCSGSTSFPAIVAKIPTDGSRTGTYTNGAGETYTYAASSYTNTPYTVNPLTATSWSTSVSATTGTEAAGSNTNASSSFGNQSIIL